MAKIVQVFIADVNGNGTQDFIVLDSNHRWTAVNGVTQRTDDIPQFSTEIPGWPSTGRYFFADFTGDGIADRAYLNSEGRWYVVKGSDGSPGVPGIPWGSSIPGWPGNGRYVVADFTGDGVANRCYIHPEGRWYVVNKDGSPGVPGIPWGSSIPGWPGGGRYIAFDFNGEGVMHRCYVHPTGRIYVVNSKSGAPMNNVSGLGNWGNNIPAALDFVFDVIMFGIAGGGCIATKNFKACVGAIAAAKAVIDDIINFVEKKKNIQHKAIKFKKPNFDPFQEPFDRPWHPDYQPDVIGGTSEPQEKVIIEKVTEGDSGEGVMTIESEDGTQTIELDPKDYDIKPGDIQNLPEAQ